MSLKLFNNSIQLLDLNSNSNSFLLWNFTQSEIINNENLYKHKSEYKKSFNGEDLILLDSELNQRIISNIESLTSNNQKETRNVLDDIIIINFLNINNFNPQKFKNNLYKLHKIDVTNGSEKPEKKKLLYYPIITIIDSNSYYKRNIENNNVPLILNFLNSNIWFYSIYFDENNPERLKNDFDNTISIINENKSIYKTTVAREFMEFQSRMAVNTYLIDLKKSSHYRDVYPFSYHSETLMKYNAFCELNDLKTKYGLFWRVLLIDDYAEDNLSGVSEYECVLTKKTIINTVINNYKNIESFIKIESVYDEKNDNRNIIWKALIKISENTYDIILLDYLLGLSDNNQNEGREYSQELLIILDGILSEKDGYGYKNNFENIKSFMPADQSYSNDKLKDLVNGIKKNKCPLDRFWIMNISSFSTAFLDRLREQGLGHNSKHWYLSRGGDSVNTPNLFAYNLFRFMKLQIDEAVIDTQEMINQFFDEVIELIEQNNNITLRDWASSYYQVFISRFGKFHILKQDRNKSTFSKTFYQYLIENKSGELEAYERFRNFLFLLANGTKQDFGQIMRSFNELSKIIEYEDSYKKEENHNLMNKLKQKITEQFPQ